MEMRRKIAKKHVRRTACLGGMILGLALPAAQAADSFFDLDLEEVLNLEITSVSKKPQTVSQAAAAVFVITADDIRRSGAKSIPEVLRMAPGLQVAQISANTWAVGSRGLNGRFANKLLVLMDGRSVYTPTFSGVYWDVQDTMMADIERIEVIRGPGAALWGANAVNGVINIISKSAAATQGGMASVSAGKEEQVTGELRYGGEAGEVGHWRVYGKGFSRDAGLIEAGKLSGHDDTWQKRVGFRTDLVPDARNSVTVQGDYYAGRSGESALLNTLTPPYNTVAGSHQEVSGWNLLGRWQRELSGKDSMTLQAYVDHTRRDWPSVLNETRTTYDLDFQYRTQQFSGHDIVMGAAYRLSRDSIGHSLTGIPGNTLMFTSFNPHDSSRKLFSIFLQDDITLIPEKLVLTLGTKLERNDYTGVEHQPNARLLWTPSETTTLWSSVARAVRTPSRIERGSEMNLSVVPPQNPFMPLPVLIQNANRGFDSESLIAYELGWKQRITPSLSVDLALFYNDYDKLRTARFNSLQPLCQPSGMLPGPGCFWPVPSSHLLWVSDIGNESSGTSRGLEFAADWRATPGLKFQFAWSWLSTSLKPKAGNVGGDMERNSPQYQASLRTSWNPRSDVDVDLWLRRVGRINSSQYIQRDGTSAYTEADLRLAWRPEKTWELSLVGRNLLHDSHQEFVSELGMGMPMRVERSVFVQVNKKF